MNPTVNQLRCVGTIILVSAVLLSIVCVNAAAQSTTDPTGDLLDKYGNPAIAEPYLDIIEAGLSQDGNKYVATIKVDGDVPSSMSDTSIWIEWAFVVDADKDPSTQPWGSWPLAVNDIGVDYMVELCLGGKDRWGRIYDGPEDNLRGTSYKAERNIITLTFSPLDIGGSKDFDYIVLVRKYGSGGARDALLVFDKAPEAGHYSSQPTVTVTQTGTSTELSEERLPSLSMNFVHATAYYNQGNEKRAEDIGEALEYAYEHLQQDFPTAPARKFQLYVYRTRSDLIEGLTIFTGMSPSQADWYRRTGGTPRPIDYIMHVSPEFDWLAVTHELTHTFIEEYSGEAFLNIKWLDEGLAGYEEWKCVSTSPAHRQKAESFRTDSWSAFSEMKAKGTLFRLGEMTTENQWESLMESGQGWYIYSEAFVVVAYLASTYGLDKVIPIFEEVKVGVGASETVETVLGTTEKEILDAVKKASPSVIFTTITATTTSVTTSRTETFATSSAVSITTTQAILTETSLESTTTIQQIVTTTRSAEEVMATQPPTDLILVVAMVAIVAGVGAVVALYRKKRSSAQDR